MKPIISICALPLLILLSGCSNDAVDKAHFQTFKGLASKLKKSQPGITAEQIKERLTPEVRAQFGGAPLLVATVEDPRFSSVLFGVGENNGTITYFTPDRVSLSFQEGILVATRGLGFDLMNADVAETRNALRGGAGTAQRRHRTLGGDNSVKARTYDCQISRDAQSRVIEACSGADDTFQNTYVVDGKGQIIFSRQWISKQRGYIRIERP